LSANITVNDLVYVNGLLYGLNATNLVEVNPTTGLVTNRAIAITPDVGNPSSVYGAGWVADNSKLFFARNSDGMIFEISDFATSSPTATIVLDGDSATGNDGASCSVARSPIPPFFATDDVGVTTINTAFMVSVENGLLANDSGRQLSVTSFTQPPNGTVIVNLDGSYTYTPNTGFTGTDIFTYVVTDEYGETETATVTITVKAVPLLASTGFSQSSLFVLSLTLAFTGMVLVRRLVTN